LLGKPDNALCKLLEWRFQEMINRRGNWRTMAVSLALLGGAVVVGSAVAQVAARTPTATSFDPFNPTLVNPTLGAQTSRSATGPLPVAEENTPAPNDDQPTLQRPPIRDPFRPPIRSPIRP
jgi:hypothetical protein